MANRVGAMPPSSHAHAQSPGRRAAGGQSRPRREEEEDELPLKRIEFISRKARAKRQALPYVCLKRRSDGRYVVIERLPASFLKTSDMVLKQDVYRSLMEQEAETGVKFRSIKPEWKYAQKEGAMTKKDKLPPIKNRWSAEAKVGSLENYNHQPGGGDIRVFHKNVQWQARSKVNSLANVNYRADTCRSDPTFDRRLKLSRRYGALADVGGSSMHYQPGRQDSPPRSKRYSNVRARVGSLENISHVPQGGDVSVPSFNHRWNAASKVGSLEKLHHMPGGGQVSIVHQNLKWKAKPKVGSLEQVTHVPRGGDVRIFHSQPQWNARSRVGSLDNSKHVPGGGNVMIFNEHKKWKAEAKIGSLPPITRAKGAGTVR